MTAIDPQLAARVAELGVPLSADWAPSKPLPGYLAAIGQAGSEYEQALYAAYLQAMAEVGRLRDELAARMEDIAFTDRATLPELRRTIQHHQDGKKRWRDRAQKAEHESDALQERLHQVALAKVWTNEDRKRFVFVEDIAGPLFGIEPKEAGR
jgi:hypothetical protein